MFILYIRKGFYFMANFRSLNSSKANQQSVKDHNENAETTVTGQLKEKKDSAFNKYNINGDKRKGVTDGEH